MEIIKTVVLDIWLILAEEWTSFDWNLLIFDQYLETIFFLVGLILVGVLALFVSYSRKNLPGRTFVVLPGLIPSFKGSPFSVIRHIPFVLFLTGLAFFTIAFASPYRSFVMEDERVQGQKIAILVDGSGSMNSSFEYSLLETEVQRSFYTAVTAAKEFISLRMKKGSNDLVAFILFGDQSYVITPFTADYQNILTSISLVGEPEEYARFEDKGTKIAQSLNQAMGLFRLFGFVGSSGNAVVLFSDGEDTQYHIEGRSIRDILSSTTEGRIPIYFIRVRSSLKYPSVGYQDLAWQREVESGGGKFYFANSESILLEAIEDINKNIEGQIDVSRYTAKRPYFLLFLVSASFFWIVASFLALLRLFSKFP